MLEFVEGDLLSANTEALVNAVNTVGVMGKGIALAFKKRFPENYEMYHSTCQAGLLDIGSMLVFDAGKQAQPRWIINFPTKKHWRNPAQLEFIEAGLIDLKRVVLELQIRSIALPALGCGLGGLDWVVVKPCLEVALADLSDVQIQVFLPRE